MSRHISRTHIATGFVAGLLAVGLVFIWPGNGSKGEGKRPADRQATPTERIPTAPARARMPSAPSPAMPARPSTLSSADEFSLDRNNITSTPLAVQETLPTEAVALDSPDNPNDHEVTLIGPILDIERDHLVASTTLGMLGEYFSADDEIAALQIPQFESPRTIGPLLDADHEMLSTFQAPTVVNLGEIIDADSHH